MATCLASACCLAAASSISVLVALSGYRGGGRGGERLEHVLDVLPGHGVEFLPTGGRLAEEVQRGVALMRPRRPFPLLHQGHGRALLRRRRGRQAFRGQRAGGRSGTARLRLLIAGLHVPSAVGVRIVDGRGGAVIVVAGARRGRHVLSTGRNHRRGTVGLRLVDVPQHVTRPVFIGPVEVLRHLEGLRPVGEVLGRAEYRRRPGPCGPGGPTPRPSAGRPSTAPCRTR